MRITPRREEGHELRSDRQTLIGVMEGVDFVLLNSIGHEFPLKSFKLRSAIASFLFLRDHCGSGLL